MYESARRDRCGFREPQTPLIKGGMENAGGLSLRRFLVSSRPRFCRRTAEAPQSDPNRLPAGSLPALRFVIVRPRSDRSRSAGESGSRSVDGHGSRTFGFSGRKSAFSSGIEREREGRIAQLLVERAPELGQVVRFRIAGDVRATVVRQAASVGAVGIVVRHVRVLQTWEMAESWFAPAGELSHDPADGTRLPRGD